MKAVLFVVALAALVCIAAANEGAVAANDDTHSYEMTRAATKRQFTVHGYADVTAVARVHTFVSPTNNLTVVGSMDVTCDLSGDEIRAHEYATADTEVIEIDTNNAVMRVEGKLDVQGEMRYEMPDQLQMSNLQIGGEAQWKLVEHDDMEDEASAGWSSFLTTQLGGNAMLGGHCNVLEGGEVSKTYTLPPHKQLRVAAKYHFLDSWDGETAFFKIGDAIKWVDTHNHAHARGVNMHGGDAAESKLHQPIDVTMRHSAEQVKLTFGSTLDEHACDESFGVDNVMLFVR